MERAEHAQWLEEDASHPGNWQSQPTYNAIHSLELLWLFWDLAHNIDFSLDLET